MMAFFQASGLPVQVCNRHTSGRHFTSKGFQSLPAYQKQAFTTPATGRSSSRPGVAANVRLLTAAVALVTLQVIYV